MVSSARLVSMIGMDHSPRAGQMAAGIRIFTGLACLMLPHTPPKEAQVPTATAALACLREVLHGHTPWHLEGRLEAGWGLVSNNVLHTRTGFDDGAKPRLFYRARYYDRIEGT